MTERSTIPSDLKFTKTHEWVRIEDNVAYVGISDHAQDLLGDLVYIELPEVGIEVHMFDEIGVIESVKAASDYYTPVSGEIIAVNEDVGDSPGIINADAYGDGWIYQLKIKDPAELDELLDAEHYASSIAED